MTKTSLLLSTKYRNFKNMSLGVSELLKAASEQPTKEAKINYLRAHNNIALATVVRYALDPNVQWLVPPELSRFAANSVAGVETLLLSESRRLYLFVHDKMIAGSPVELSPSKRQTLFSQLLDMISAEDVRTLDLAIQKKLPYGLDYDLILEAFPGLLPAVTFQAEVMDVVNVPTPPKMAKNPSKAKKTKTKMKKESKKK